MDRSKAKVIYLVSNMNNRVEQFGRCLNTLQRFENSFTLSFQVWMAKVKDMCQLVCHQGVLKGCAKTSYQLCWNITDKADSVDKQNLDIGRSNKRMKEKQQELSLSPFNVFIVNDESNVTVCTFDSFGRNAWWQVTSRVANSWFNGTSLSESVTFLINDVFPAFV